MAKTIRKRSQLVMYSATLMLASCTHSSLPQATSSPAEKSAPTRVRAVAVEAAKVTPTTQQPATVQAYYRTEIRARVSGYISELKVDIGDFVDQGAPLAIIAVPEMQQAREVAKAHIEKQLAEEQAAMSGIALANARIQSAEAKLAQTESEIQRAAAALAAIEAEFSRTEDLVARRSLENRMLDEVRKKRDSETANQSAVLSARQSAAADVVVAQAEHAAAEAGVSAAKAATRVAQRQLGELDAAIEYATLRAPFAGVITQRSVNPGDLVRQSSEVGVGAPLFVVSQIDPVRVHIPVPEMQAASITVGTTATISFPSFPGEANREAPVTRIAGELDPSTRTMLVEVELENADKRLLPGMFGQASIALPSDSLTNTLPARAIRFDEKGQAYVYVIDENQTVKNVPVGTGFDDGKRIEVTTGLAVGDRVIDAHLKRFANGEVVSILAD
ncbi:Efflux pump periplasmic linker BepF [Aureliella helgolandensis]|uniref:Efflux pump periplasmic linker BepF n=2 Tax=Aureliella helgolandensis TaxID=2527968 RepID=A0A518G1L7_9BACT|nr:Efflux pump periplasmic linker BepF [Aureliella helgolandensis]